jgi:UDP-N-acetylglucosamine enolpyruvyl transferase
VAALCAEGESTIEGAEILSRGYDALVEKLRRLGAAVQ